MIILCVTQCSHGGVAAFYETGKVGTRLLLLLLFTPFLHRLLFLLLLLLLFLMLLLFTLLPVVVVVVLPISRCCCCHVTHYQVLMNAGAIPGLDITPEAALAKLAHVLSLPIRSSQKNFLFLGNPH